MVNHLDIRLPKLLMLLLLLLLGCSDLHLIHLYIQVLLVELSSGLLLL